MSVRPEAEDHVRVRGTMVSTFMSQPSKLPVSCVQTWGMPNRHGVVHVDGHILHIRYDHKDPQLIHVWAREADATARERRHARARGRPRGADDDDTYFSLSPASCAIS